MFALGVVMLDWIKKNKKFLITLALTILQNVGVLPPLVSVDTKSEPVAPQAE